MTAPLPLRFYNPVKGLCEKVNLDYETVIGTGLSEKMREVYILADIQKELKDIDKKETTKMLKGLQLQQIKSLHLWKEAHPNYMEDDDLKHEYMILVNKCTKPLSESEKKLFKNLCDNTYIKDEL